MSKLILRQKVLGMVQTNCYFLMNEETKELLLIDPADNFAAIDSMILSMQAKPVAILLTHGHFDHIMAVKDIKKKYPVIVYACEDEREVLEDSSINLSAAYGVNYTIQADTYVNDGEELEIAGFYFQVLHTPGHTCGSVCYYMEEEKILFSGDTLFAESVGRTDFPTSSTSQMQQSLHRLLEELPDDTDVYPGHMDATTIGHEKRYNPFA